MAELEIQSPFCADRRLAVSGRISIGRASDNDLFLPDQKLSRRHAEIQGRADGHWIVDLGSTNGTFLNGERVRGESRLAPGDVVTVGETTLTFHDRERSKPTPDEPELQGVRALPIKTMVTRATRRSPLDPPDALDRARVLALLGQTTTELLRHVPYGELHERVLDAVLAAIPAERAAILLVDGAGALRVCASRTRDGGPPITHVSTALATRVMERQVTLLLADVAADVEIGARKSIVATGTRSVLCAPLWLHDEPEAPARVLGIVYLDSRQRASAFQEGDLQLLTVLANVVAAKLENAQLLERTLAMRRIEEDLRLAAEIQASLLPAVPPTVAGWDLAGATRSCRAVGGDYYDFLATGETLHVALGDVSGKGVAAAMLMTALRAAVRAHWLEGSPATVVPLINRTFRQCVPEDKYATFFLGCLDLQAGSFVYVNAGHNRPLLVRSGSRVEALSEGGTIIGAFDGVVFRESRVDLAPGDTLLVFSDGVSDAWPDADEADRALVELVRAHAPSGADEVQRAVFRAVEERSDGRAPDDRTVIVLRRRSATAERKWAA